jgi:hypothetical protein
MRITERLTLGEYWEDIRFEDRKPERTPRPDNFSRRNSSGTFIQVPNRVHTQAHAPTDLSGRYVLLSDRFWYFGQNSVPIPTDLIHLVHSSVGHTVDKHRRPDDAVQLQRWLGTWPEGINGEPVDNQIFGPFAQADSSVSREFTPRAVTGRVETRKARSCAASPTTDPRRLTRTFEAPRITEAPLQSPRRLILSRKGFDSGYGGMPSAILPDGRLLPFPIPSNHDAAQMQDCGIVAPEFADVLSDLSQGRYDLSSPVHLDPDLNRRADQRLPGWRPALGQTGAAQSHLSSQGVERGDVFLFFGWFREVTRSQGKWRYVPSAPNLHMIFGWLEIDDVLSIVTDRQACLERYSWVANHAHVANPAHYSNYRNTLYIASERSAFRPDAPGGGAFTRFENKLRLTAPGESRSVWQLPNWFYPGERTPLSYHGRPDRWARQGNHCKLHSVAKGQEFVLKLDEYPESLAWLRTILNVSAGSS